MNHSQKMTVVALVAMCFLGCLTAQAQEIHVQRQEGPYYVGEPVVVRVSVSVDDASAEVNCSLKGEAPDGLTVEGPQMSHSSQSMMQMINGRITRSESVSYQFSFAATANREGQFLVGPFEVTCNGKSQEVAGETLSFGKLDNDPDMQIEFSVPQSTVYVGQEIPVTIRWSCAGDINSVQYAFSKLQIRSPLFDQFSFRNVRPRSRTRLTIATTKGDVEIDADVTRQRANGREVFVVTGTRTLIADTQGQYSAIPITCRTRKVTQWNRDIFGLSPRSDVPAMAAGKPLNLTVKEIPRPCPPSYSGAVGRSFSIEASANRSVVRLGDPISLTITIHGDGNLDRVSMPALEANPGFSADRFQIPQEQVAGTIDGNQKQFSVNIRVKDQSVKQIPAVAFSWFDPYEEHFGTAASQPIDLQVMETQVISASDVVSSNANHEASSTADNSAPGQAASGASSPDMTFVGANLAITRDPARLLASGTATATPRTIAVFCYVLAAIALAGGIVGRRQNTMDKGIVRKRKHLQTIRGQIDAAEAMPPRDAAVEIARALRELIAEFDLRDPSAVDRIIARCDNMVYTTGTLDDSHLSEIVSQARQIVRETIVSR